MVYNSNLADKRIDIEHARNYRYENGRQDPGKSK
jgi:hypothetical protein